MPASKSSAAPAEGKTPLTRFLRVAVSVAAVCAIGAIVAIYFAVRSPSIPTAPVRATAQNFFNDLKTKNFHDAYGSLCGITKQSFTEAQFVSSQQDLATVDSFTIASVSTQRVNGAPAGTVVVNLTRTGGAIEHHSVPMVKQGEQWFVCGEPY
jgi:hypothetical protein